MKHSLTLLTLLGLSLAACGQDDVVAAPYDAGDASPVAVDVSPDAQATTSGVAINHSMNRLAAGRTGRTPAYNDITLEIASVDALTAGSAAVLGTTALNTSACSAMGGCAWSVAGVELSGATLGLAARLRDNRTASALWVTTATGFAGPADVNTAGTTGLYGNGRAFAVSRDAIDTVIAPLVGLTGDEVMARGFIFGLIYNRYEGGAGDGSGTPVVGAAVSASVPSMRIVYPNNMFSGTVGSTASQGAFLAVPDAPGGALAVRFLVTPPRGESLSWDATRVTVSAPGLVYFTPMYAR